MDQDTKRKMQEALAEKRKRLQDIKDSKKKTVASSPEPSAPKAKEDLDSFLNDINTLIPKSAPAANKQEDNITSPPKSDAGSTTSTTTTTSSHSLDSKSHAPRRKFNLSLQANVIQIDIPPKETPTYTKGTQTDAASTPQEDEPKLLNVSGARMRRGTYKQTKEEEGGSGESENTNTTGEQKTEAEENTKEPEEIELPELSQEEKEKIYASTDFQEFFERATRVVDRALFVGESLDIMEDYKTEDKQQTQAEAREAVLKATFFDDRWSKHRSITDLAWSTKHPELIVAAYSANEAGTQDADGCCLVWNVNTLLTTPSSSTSPSSPSPSSSSSSSSPSSHSRKSTPEFVFSCQSQVTTAQFSKFHATMVVGGTYSGQIVLWDTRAKSIPVQRTPLSAVGHTHPVYSLAIVGSANAHNLVSISTDGRLCVWNLENLSHPSETLELSNKLNKPVTAPVAVTSLSFPEGEVNSFLVGSEEGAIFQGYRHGTTSGITERYDGHFGPITATDFHPARGNIDFSHLFLSSSTDWSCKLWSSKHGTRSLYSFEEATDYIYDTRWSPTHPAVFATADGNGILDVWNLNEDTEAPVLKASAGPSSGGRALNRLIWSADGKRIISGDAAGCVYLYDVGDIAVPDANEWNRFEEVLSQMSGSSLKNKPSSSSYDEDSVATPRDTDDFNS